MEQAIIGLLVGIGGLLTAGGIGARLLFQRMGRLEEDSAAHQKALKEERDGLRRRVADLEAQVGRVPALEKQVATLISQLAEMQVRQAALERALDEANNREVALRCENEDLRAERDELRQAVHDLKTANATYERAMTLLGLERVDREKKVEGSGDERAGESSKQTEQTEQEG